MSQTLLPSTAIIFYLISYTVASLGAFGILMWLESSENDNLTLDDISGLAQRHPYAAFGMSVFMFSLAGMPPTAGFLSKFFVFNAALQQQFYTLVIIGVIGSAISL